LTQAELALWHRLRNRALGAKFRRQAPLGGFIVDFYCHEGRTVIELDGGVHRESSQAAYDQERDEWLAERGFHVLRFDNSEVERDIDAVLARIVEALTLCPSPAPRERGAG
jgi:very-short-patch-repair endonuclease